MGTSKRGTYERGRELLADDPVRLVLLVILLVLILDLVRQLMVGQVEISEFGVMLKDGLMRGLFFGLAGIGLSMTYSILNFANFSHGDLITSGSFAGMSVTYLIAGIGTEANLVSLLLVGAGGSVFGASLGIGVATSPLAVVAGVIVAGISAILLSLFIDRIVYRPIRDRSGITLLITSIGVAFALRYLIQFVFGPARRGVTASGSVPSVAIPAFDGIVNVNLHEVSLFVVAVSLMAGLHFLLQRTKLGKAMRAMADNKDLAQITGIPTERVVRFTWIIGAGLAGVAGYMFVIWNGTLHWFQGWILLLPVFAAVILGGIGSIYGAIVGGLIIGMTMSVSVIWLPTGLSRAAAFLIMIVVLLVRPQGIFAGRTTA
ncbi:branched-chain amino acid ABC transporter permease [Natronomonas salina]|nr:branched-chain amino acid ABC transporter permease [Natronomonas salina]QLD91123.1 branched-chain amino acid ABC transporter permease [Natronomonas salina]